MKKAIKHIGAMSLLISLCIPLNPAAADGQYNSQGQLAFNSDGSPLAGFNSSGQWIGAPDIAPPSAGQYNSNGQLAFRPDGTPLPGFNAAGQPVALTPPTDPTGVPGSTKLPLGPSVLLETTPIPASGCLDLGVAYAGTRFQVTFGEICGEAEIKKWWGVIADYAAWVSTQPIEAPKSNVSTSVKKIEDGVVTETSGRKIDMNTGALIPSKITDAQLKAVVDSEIKGAVIKAIKEDGGYLLESKTDFSAIDTSLKVVAIKNGVSKKLSLTGDKDGNLFIKSKGSLKGSTLQISRAGKVLKTIKVTK